MNKIRVGGQAFGDGVLMRSKRFWALVREDGSIEFGSLTSWLDHHSKWNIFLIRSVVTFIEMAGFGLQTYKRNPVSANKRLLFWMAVYVVFTLPFSMLIRHWLGAGMIANLLSQFFYLAAALWAVSKGMTGRIWTYHGAEHKAVNAYENDCDLNDVVSMQSYSRVHQRCGTNLVFLILVATAFYMPYPDAKINVLLSGFYTVLAMAMSLELFRQLMRWPQFIITKIVLFGGKVLQRFVTTKEPDDNQVVVASKALQLVLALEAME